MREQDYKPISRGQEDCEDELDRILDSALAMFSSIEARAGLEERVLANLRTEESTEHRTWWAWGFAAVALTLVILAVTWHSKSQTQRPIANRIATPAGVKPTKSGSLQIPVIGSASSVRRAETPKHHAPKENPKLDQFPSPQPLSEQEKIMAMYINEYPENAALIAEARMEALHQDMEERRRIAEQDEVSQP